MPNSTASSPNPLSPAHAGHPSPPGLLVPSGIGPLDDRVGGLREGGSYLVTGVPGPVKLVFLLHFLEEGLAAGDRVGLITSASADEVLSAADAWGVKLREGWEDGRLVILGFRDDFELRATRSVSPDDVMDELDGALGLGLTRIAVDPGRRFLTGGVRTLLGGAYLRWASRYPATVCTTFSVDDHGGSLPAEADWLIHATDGRLVVERRPGELYQVTLVPDVPAGMERVEPVSLQLIPGQGLRRPSHFPSRRGEDRGDLDPERLLLLTLGRGEWEDLQAWAETSFDVTTTGDLLAAIEAVQDGGRFGCVLVAAPRAHIEVSIRACRSLRPLTRAAFLFLSDDDIRSSDRVEILEAGADDCLTGGLDLPELSLRLRQALASGARHARPPGVEDELDELEGLRGGVADLDGLRAAIRDRAEGSLTNVFCLLRFTEAPLPADELEAALLQEIRDDAGDLICPVNGAHLVLLQGARRQQSRPFLDRMAQRLSTRGGGGTVDVWSHPGEAEEIARVLEGAGGRSG